MKFINGFSFLDQTRLSGLKRKFSSFSPFSPQMMFKLWTSGLQRVLAITRTPTFYKKFVFVIRDLSVFLLFIFTHTSMFWVRGGTRCRPLIWTFDEKKMLVQVWPESVYPPWVIARSNFTALILIGIDNRPSTTNEKCWKCVLYSN